MNTYRRLGLTLFLALVMIIGTTIHAFAAPEDYGPSFEPGFNPNKQNQTYREPAGPGVTQTEPAQEQETAASDGNADAQGPGVPVTDQELSSSEEKEASAILDVPVDSPLAVPHRTPRLQTTVLLTDVHQWSQAFVNDQQITVDGRPFYSVSTFLEQIHGDFLYRVYTTAHGWTRWAMNGQQTDIPADFASVEAIQCRFSGPVNDQYDIYYCTTLSNGQTTGWVKNGETAGTMNQGLYMTGYRLAFFPKGTNPGLDSRNSLVSAHADGVQYVDGALRYIHGDGSNYTGWGWVGNDRYYFVDSWPVTGWQYIDGYKYYFAEDGHMLSDVEPLIGAGGPFEIKINKQMNCLTIFAQDGGNGFIIPVKSFLTSTGDDTPLGTFRTPEKYRWRLMIHDLYTQYATRLGSGLSILMHSIIYDAANPYTVWASTYNNLGIARSAGCIRLTTADSKWIYDHCALGTSVTVYNSPVPGPFERPTIAAEIPFEQTWDPTDPSVTPEGIAAETARILGTN